MDNNDLSLKQRVAEKLGTSEKIAEELISLTIKKIESSIIAEKDVSIPLLGTFEVKNLPGKKALFFRASQELLNQ